MIQYEVLKTTAAGGRRGRLSTAHGTVETPAFMPVGTCGTVKGVAPDALRGSGVEIVLSNTYHLALRPGAKTISKLGGLHRFMGWDGPILTDSGGYQLFSLAANVRLSEEGASFRSHIDGAKFELTPERAVEIQRTLGVDIGMAFDALTGEAGDRDAAAASAERTIRWARRTREAVEEGTGVEEAPEGAQTSFFGIMQGGLFDDLRAENAGALTELGFPGYAVGGLSVGEAHDETMRVARTSVALLPKSKPRYMMGMGTPTDLVDLCRYGYDMFDCVIPTRNARNGTLFTRDGQIGIRNAVHREDADPIEEGCDCQACSGFSRAYVHHLIRRKEMLGAVLASIHNIRFYQRLMSDIRQALADDDYDAFQREFLARYQGGEA